MHWSALVKPRQYSALSRGEQWSSNLGAAVIAYCHQEENNVRVWSLVVPYSGIEWVSHPICIDRMVPSKHKCYTVLIPSPAIAS